MAGQRGRSHGKGQARDGGRQKTDKEFIGETYRRCCTSHAWVGEALAARIMHAEKYWGHDAFFDYVDRWMTEDDAEFIRIIKQETGKDFSAKFMRQKQSWDPFVNEMWSKYRNNLMNLK